VDKKHLAKSIWAMANKMRGTLDANDYKDFILGFMFYKFLSEKEEDFWIGRRLPREKFEDHLTEKNPKAKKAAKDNLGYFIAFEDLFSTWVEKGEELQASDVINGLNHFELNVSADYKHVFEGVFTSFKNSIGKLGTNASSQAKKLREIIDVIVRLPKGHEEAYDVLGYIYEYLIGQFAANAGKKAGEFYTPHQVALVMAEIVAEHVGDRDRIDTYDPTAGSGSLLLNIGSEVEKRTGKRDQVKYYAQELKQDTYNLTRMNLVMRGVDPTNIVTRNADSLEEDWPEVNHYTGRTEPLLVDAVVSNPPYSHEWERDKKENDLRFEYGLAPAQKADYAFLQHELYHLRNDGVLTIVLPHGVLFRGGDEEKIRRNLVDRNRIDAIIGLPANIFYGTSIATIIMVLRKDRSDTDVLVVDASRGFEKEGKKNQLRARDVRKIVDTVVNRREVDHFSRIVTREEIVDNDYNLNIPRYVDSEAVAETWDIYSTMFGGIPNAEIDTLERYWEAMPGLRDALFAPGSTPKHSVLRVDNPDVAILQHPAAIALYDHFRSSLSGFDDDIAQKLLTDPTNVSVNVAEAELRHNLFERLTDLQVVDPYSLYQVFSNVWDRTSAHLEVLGREGWEAVRGVDPNIVMKKRQKTKEEYEDQEGWLGRVLPFEVVQRHRMSSELLDLEQTQNRLEAAAERKTELFDQLDEENYLIAQISIVNKNETDFVKGGLQKAIKLYREDKTLTDEDQELLEFLVEALEVFTRHAGLRKAEKAKREALHEKTKDYIENIRDEDARELLRYMWAEEPMAAFRNVHDDEMAALGAAVRHLDAKYAETLGDVGATIERAGSQLATMMEQLEGSDEDMKGLQALMQIVGGDANE